jgi:hypothetical protein
VGPPWVAPGASLPLFMRKFFVKVFGNFREILFLGNFQNLNNDSVGGKQLWNDEKPNQNQIYNNSQTL